MTESGSANILAKPDFQAVIDQYRHDFEVKSDGFKLPLISYEFTITRNLNLTESVFFFAIPIKNQESLIEEVLKNLFENLSTLTDVGLLFDNCDDASFERAADYIQGAVEVYELLNQVHFIRSKDELFESTCENVLFQLCKAPYFVSFQADTLIRDSSFFERCQLAFKNVPSLLGISGRATVPLMPSKLLVAKLIWLFFTKNLLTVFWPRVFKRRRLGPFFNGKDYFGDTSGFPLPTMKFSKRELNTLFVGQALIRGPIVWSAESFRNLAGFDDVSFFLGRDDCDLSLRGLMEGFVVGYLPCDQVSNPSFGTTRKPRTEAVQVKLNERADLSLSHKGTLDFYWNSTARQRKRILNNCKFGEIRINQ
jgi:hypothetical protein